MDQLTPRDRNGNRVAVIGAGLGGLAASCTLAARGHEVLLFEKNPWLGGKAAVLEEKGFRFDMGPTILTLPSVLRRIYAEAGKKLEDEIDLVRLDPQWRSFFDDGTTLDLHENVDRMTEALEDYSPNTDAGESYRRFLDLSKRLHEISDKFFFWRSVGGVLDTFEIGGTFQLSVLSDLLQLRPGQSVAKTIRSFVKDPRVSQMLDHFTQYVGSSPEASPAVLCSIANMQTSEGLHYPRGGTGAVPKALAKLAAELGVETRLETGIRRIVTSRPSPASGERPRVLSVITDRGEEIPVGTVVSNMDSVLTHQQLLGDQAKGTRSAKRAGEPACSGVVLYLGLDKSYDHLLHHNFVFSKDPEEEFDWIYNRGEPAPDPTCYVCATTKTEPETAPAGGESLYVLVHTPYLRSHQDWKKLLPEYRRTILDKLARTAGLEDLESRIVVEKSLTPVDIGDRYRCRGGAIYGLASHGKFLGAFKPANRNKEIDGLYLAGGAAHPGPGMPMVLMSGWIAADCLDHDRKRVGDAVAVS